MGPRKRQDSKKTTSATKETDSLERLMKEQEEKTSKRKTKDPVEATKEPQKRARKETKKNHSGEEEKASPKVDEAATSEQDRGGAAPPRSSQAVEGVVTINRAPTLTLWVAAVAQREGYTPEEGLSFGKYISGVFAHTKGKSLGVFDSDPEKEARAKEAKRKQREGLDKVPVFGMEVRVKKTPDGQLRALGPDGKPIEPKPVKAYLHRAFKDKLEAAQEAMAALTAAYAPEEVGKKAYHLYERFRPTVSQGTRGWGKKGELDLDLISNKMVQETTGAR
jgi:hypothetical protein